MKRSNESKIQGEKRKSREIIWSKQKKRYPKRMLGSKQNSTSNSKQIEKIYCKKRKNNMNSWRKRKRGIRLLRDRTNNNYKWNSNKLWLQGSNRLWHQGSNHRHRSNSINGIINKQVIRIVNKIKLIKTRKKRIALSKTSLV